jgi:hypothetical protein
MKTRTLVSILILVLVVLFMTVSPWHQVVADDSDISRPEGKVIFEIGQEDKSDREFRRSGLSGQTEYRCQVGVDCSTEAFPAYLISAEITTGYGYGGVEHITIIFKLKRAYNNVVLRLVRGGDETTVVTVDGKQTHLVTNTMLGSSEGYRVGVYNLTLGALQKGEHTIEMTMADDGKGNYVYQWDALALFAK